MTLRAPMTLERWLEYIERLHPRSIELGLERVREVLDRLSIDYSGSRIVTVGGTNGKGSTCALLVNILRAAGFTAGFYTSPHLLKYNERICLNDGPVSDEALCEAFAVIEQARGDIPLTYFEFGTLAALLLMSRAGLDYLILEVGMGGRLDAVNVVDPDLAIVTNVALDHTDWLGHDREEIGTEKAGIFRSGKPALYGERDMPASVAAHAERIGARLYSRGEEFNWSRAAEATVWDWQGLDANGNTVLHSGLPYDTMPLVGFLDNAALVLQAIHLLEADIDEAAIISGLLSATVPGRFQVFNRGHTLVLDVGHNPHAARHLVSRLQQTFPGRRINIVIAMLATKDVRGVLETLKPLAGKWYLGDLQTETAAPSKMLYNTLLELEQPEIACFDSLEHAFIQAEQKSGAEDVVLVTGSFYTVSAVMELL